MDGKILGFISHASFCIESVKKTDRNTYFSEPYVSTPMEYITRGKNLYLQFSIGPDNSKHPGLPEEQAAKIRQALAAGIKLMRGQNWLGLPAPAEINEPDNFVLEDGVDRAKREERQLEVSARIDARGVGRRAFEAAGGWEGLAADEKKLIKACAEWADGELAAAHIAYQNDILCTDDFARGTRTSIFNEVNRSWLISEYFITIMTVKALAETISK